MTSLNSLQRDWPKILLASLACLLLGLLLIGLRFREPEPIILACSLGGMLLVGLMLRQPKLRILACVCLLGGQLLIGFMSRQPERTIAQLGSGEIKEVIQKEIPIGSSRENVRDWLSEKQLDKQFVIDENRVWTDGDYEGETITVKNFSCASTPPDWKYGSLEFSFNKQDKLVRFDLYERPPIPGATALHASTNFFMSRLMYDGPAK